MPTDPNTVQPPPPVPPTTGNPPATTPPPATPPPQNAQPPAPPPREGGKTLMFKEHQMAKLKEEQRAKGKKDTLNELNKRAQALGYKDHEDLLGHASAFKKAPKEDPAAPNAPAGTSPPAGQDPHTQRLLAQEQKNRERLARQLEEEKKARKSAERKAREAQREKENFEAEMDLREAALRAGCTDVDYSLSVLRRETAALSDEQLKGFDENKWFAEYKKRAPHLFGEVVIPANTGTTAPPSNAPPPPPAQTTGQNANAGKFDAKTATPDQVRKRYQELGLRPPA